MSEVHDGRPPSAPPSPRETPCHRRPPLAIRPRHSGRRLLSGTGPQADWPRSSVPPPPAGPVPDRTSYGRGVASEVDVRWLLVSVTTAGAVPSLRMQVWRKLKGLGALYLQQSVCLLPDRPSVAQALAELGERVRADGGRMRVVHIEVADEAERTALAQEMGAAVEAEYAEVLERLPSFFTELDTETARGRAVFAEVEESEADLERFRSWVAKIEARDYFGALLGIG